MARIVGSDIAHAVPLTLIAGSGHWLMGSVDWHIIGSLLAGSLPGIFVGSYFAVRIPERALKLVLACVLFVVASRMAYEHVGSASSISPSRAGPCPEVTRSRAPRQADARIRGGSTSSIRTNAARDLRGR